MEKQDVKEVELFDLADTEDMTEAEIQLRRNGVPLPIFVKMAGPEHPKRKNYMLAKNRKTIRQLQKTGKMDLGDPVENEAEENDLLADCTLGWRTASGEAFLLLAGERLACTRDNVRKIIGDAKRAWFRKALKEAFDDNEAFIKVSAGD